MKEQIEQLIESYKESRKEVWSLLGELNQVDITKLTIEEINSLKESTIRYQEEYSWRGVFMSELQDLF